MHEGRIIISTTVYLYKIAQHKKLIKSFFSMICFPSKRKLEVSINGTRKC